MTTYAYLRTSTDKQDLSNQKLAILEYVHKHGLHVDEFLEISISSRKTTKDRRIDELMDKMRPDDIVIASELSRLGRSTAEVIGLVNELVKRGMRVILIKQGMDLKNAQDMATKVMITLFSLFAELERDIISLRTKEALANKRKKGVVLGKPKGTIQPSKFDKDLSRIKELLRLGLSAKKVAAVLEYDSASGLIRYIRTRNLKFA